MNWNSLKPEEYPDSMTVRIIGIVCLGFLLEMLLENILPTIHNYYQSQYGGLYDGGLLSPSIFGYMFWIFPVTFYSFTIPKTKLFQGIFFTTIIMLPLVWIDYWTPSGFSGPSETIHIFRYTFFSVPFMFMLHVLLPEPSPLQKKIEKHHKSETEYSSS
ncbi:hypothetical protein [Salibacterium qingdaonense]|uniref:Uncharacterized protein n=1 Tax=Salibacterium qingdaonense TaxID=266892 RepID=A0A1I4PMA3_9BACI|nr:hypothetical protein [Salibacterium qingdaonense]SFM29001.1 hypothetical protein SAMN04488054_1295 [Salibacterium qingdaonense]